MKTARVAALVICAVPVLWAQPPCRGPLADIRIVELRGTIERISISPGRGMPFLDVQDGSKTMKVYLGSIRYLIEQDFNPKAGQKTVITAYAVNDGFIAFTVSLAGNDRVLRLRDSRGLPVWRGGPRRCAQP